MDNRKGNFLITICWYLLGITFVLSIITTLEAWPLSPGSYFDRAVARMYMNDLSIGLFCSTALVIFVEKYHYLKDIKVKEHNRTILLDGIIESINENCEGACKRADIMSVYSGIRLSVEEDRYKEAIRFESSFLSDRNGRWTYGRFIFVRDETYQTLFSRYFNNEEGYNTREIMEHLVLVKLYHESLNSIRKLRIQSSVEQFSSFKIAGVIEEREFEALKSLYETIDELFSYLEGVDLSTRLSIEKYNIVQSELFNTYNIFFLSEDR